MPVDGSYEGRVSDFKLRLNVNFIANSRNARDSKVIDLSVHCGVKRILDDFPGLNSDFHVDCLPRCKLQPISDGVYPSLWFCWAKAIGEVGVFCNFFYAQIRLIDRLRKSSLTNVKARGYSEREQQFSARPAYDSLLIDFPFQE